MNVRLIRIVPALVFFVLATLLFSRDPVTATQADLTVRWEGITANLLKGHEPAEPATRTFPNVPPETLKWQLHAGELGGPSRQLHETRRLLRFPNWSADGQRIGVGYAMYDYELSKYFEQAIYPWTVAPVAAGVLSFDSRSATSLPTDLAIGPFVGAFDVLLGGAKALLLDSPVRFTSSEAYEPPPILMVDAERMTAFTPIGLPGRVRPAADRGSWSPDGDSVLLNVVPRPYFVMGPPSNITGAPQPPASVYNVSTVDGTARLVATDPAQRAMSRPVWSSSAPYLAAFTLEGALWVFDPSTGSRRVTPDNLFAQYDQLTWHDAQHVWTGSKLVDLTTGAITSYDLGKQSYSSQPSPDGRYAVSFAFPSGGFPSGGGNEAPQCPESKHQRPQNKLALFDTTTGTAASLKDCDGRAFIRFQWLADSRHVVMTGSSTACCHGGHQLIVLKDVLSGAEVPLTRGYESGAIAFLSPDRQKVIVVGDKLRVYDSAGTLLQEKDPPTGFSVTDAAWAPDSKRFAFVVGPTGVQVL